MYSSARALEPIDLRLVFRGYAVLAGLGGFVLAAWGPMWLGVDMAGQPFGRAALIRVFGAILMAAACCAAGVASVNDLTALRRGLLWFGAGHTGVALMVLLQRTAVWGEGPASWAGQFLLALCWVLWSFWLEGVSGRSQFRGLFSGANPAGSEELRSTYERQIREAARQEERNRLARDLHDSIKQQIFVIQTAAATVEARFDDDRNGARQAVEQIRASAREAATEMHVMLDQLRAVPLEKGGLVEALKKQCEALGFRTGARVEFELGSLPPDGALPPGAHEAILRAAQEALANVGRHARAANVRVSLDCVDHFVKLGVTDDGAGFDPNQATRGFGIANMRARAEEFGGTFELASRPGGGTSIALSIPYEDAVPPRRYLGNTAAVGAAMLVFGVVSLLTGKFRTTAIMVFVICAISLLRNLSAYRRVRGGRGR
jgi:signal transduction histidine kinase